jgi:hypothetical protein
MGMSLLWVCASLVASGSALAQRAPDRTVYRSKTVISFGDMAIDGETRRPDGEVIFAPPKTVFPTLVRVRQSFAEEIRRSVDEL